MDMAADILEKLNDSQRQAVTSTEGNVRVIAGAGSGKTRALAVRFAYLVNEMGILPGNILCVTFSNKAANEMRRRIHNLTGDNDTGYVCTFHSFCVSSHSGKTPTPCSIPRAFLCSTTLTLTPCLPLSTSREVLPCAI